MSDPTLNISESEFSKIRTAIIDYLSSQSEFLDYNFEASGLSYLVDIVAYLGHYLAFHLNMSVNEIFLDACQLRKNAVLTAKTLNYIPHRPTGGIAVIDLEIKEEYKPVDPSKYILIPKYTVFSSQGFYFYTTESYVLNYANDYKAVDIQIKQGVLTSQTFTSSGQPLQSIVIQSPSVDNEELTVTVDGTEWSHQNDITELDDESKIYRTEEDSDGYLNIIFGDGIIGKIPDTGVSIVVSYSETRGASSNNLDTFSLSSILSDGETTYDIGKVLIVTSQQSMGGTDLEDIESIKANAPLFYQSQNRLVTKTDFSSYLEQHPLVDLVNVWGGEEDTFNPKYGTVYICIKPNGGENLNTTQKAQIVEYLTSKMILTIQPELVDVEYFWIDISGTIYFNQQYESQLNQVRIDVENCIIDFFDTDLASFDSLFKYAKFITALNNLEKIENTNVVIQPHFYFAKIGTGSYYWILDNEITPGSVDSDIITGILNEGFYDDENGNILTKKSGNAIIGEIDYENGTIEIYPGYIIAATEPDDGFRVNFSVTNDDVFYKKNRLCLLGSTNLIFTRYV